MTQNTLLKKYFLEEKKQKQLKQTHKNINLFILLLKHFVTNKFMTISIYHPT